MKPGSKKLIILALSLLIGAFLAYQLSLKKAISAYAEYKKLRDVETRSGTITAELQLWQKKVVELDALTGTDILQGFEANLLNTIGLFCESRKLKVERFVEPYIGEQNGYRVETILIEVQGNFKSLLSLLHHLETDFKGGRISSVAFQKKKNYKKRKDELFLEIYVQNITPLK
jgi:hypothetical protein